MFKQLVISDHLLKWHCSIDVNNCGMVASNSKQISKLKERLFSTRDPPQLNKTVIVSMETVYLYWS